MPRSTPSRPILFVVALVGVLLACAVASPTAHADKPAPVVADVEAYADLVTLTRYLKDRKAINSQIIQYLDLVATDYVEFKVPDMPVKDPRLQKLAESARVGYRKAAEKQFFRALTQYRVRDGVNRRNGVNLHAAMAIGKLADAYPGEAGEKARTALSRKLRKEILGLERVRHELDPDVLNASFAALARLGSLESLAWMLKEFAHTKSVQRDWLLAAHAAMVQFPADPQAAEKAHRAMVPGSLRLAIVDRFISIYSGVENAANTSSAKPAFVAKKRFWDDIKNTTIPVMQHFARQPRNPETNEALASMKEFQAWFRKHDHARKAPWADPK